MYSYYLLIWQGIIRRDQIRVWLKLTHRRAAVQISTLEPCPLG